MSMLNLEDPTSKLDREKEQGNSLILVSSQSNILKLPKAKKQAWTLQEFLLSPWYSNDEEPLSSSNDILEHFNLIKSWGRDAHA